MEELYKLLIAIGFLILGIPIGGLLARMTKEELKQGKNYFKYLIVVSLVGAIVFLILGNDALLFGMLFIAIVASRSLNGKKR
jgi:hypothetical protein